MACKKFNALPLTESYLTIDFCPEYRPTLFLMLGGALKPNKQLRMVGGNSTRAGRGAVPVARRAVRLFVRWWPEVIPASTGGGRHSGRCPIPGKRASDLIICPPHLGDEFGVQQVASKVKFCLFLNDP